MNETTKNILSEAVQKHYREQLRTRILEERGNIPFPGRFEAECGVCWQWGDPGDWPMHEALVPRGWVVGRAKEARDVAFHPCNVVLRHTTCPPVEIVFADGTSEMVQFVHEAGTGGDLAFKRCAIHLVRYETFERVHEYLKAVYSDVPYHAGNAFDRFMALEGDAEFEAARQYSLKGITEEIE